MYAVYICQKSLNFVYAFKCYQQKYVSWPHFSWTTLYTEAGKEINTQKTDSLELLYPEDEVAWLTINMRLTYTSHVQ